MFLQATIPEQALGALQQIVLASLEVAAPLAQLDPPLQSTKQSFCALHVTFDGHDEVPWQATVHESAPQVIGLLHADPPHVILHESVAVQSTVPAHALVPAQSTLQVLPAHATVELHADPPQSIRQLAACAQSMGLAHEFVPVHCTQQGTAGGHVMGEVHEDPVVQSNQQMPPSRHAPPASGHVF